MLKFLRRFSTGSVKRWKSEVQSRAEILENATPPFAQFASRRSVVHSTNGIVACTQPLAAQAGVQILRNGGNAADAAVAVAAALNVTEPNSTGIGGDMFCLFYSAKDRKVYGLNGSGRAPAGLTLAHAREALGLPGDGASGDHVDEEGAQRIPMDHVLAVSVPGACAGWCDVVEKFGSGNLSLSQLLEEPIRLAEEGFPVSQLSAMFWKKYEQHVKNASKNYGEILKLGSRAPGMGEVMKMPTLARTFREVAERGKSGFYEGRIAEEMVSVVQEREGVLALEDLRKHRESGSQETKPISIEFEGVRVWEHAPSGQGIVALMALGIIQILEKRKIIGKLGSSPGLEHNSLEYLHVLIEALRIAFSDGHWWITDPDVEKVPTRGLLSEEYLSERAKLFNPSSANDSLHHGSPAFQSCDTVYFSVTDAGGNGCSFINSVFGGFGSGIVPKDCGFALQNRASGFSLRADHPNVVAPNKRPYHTIIPGMVTDLSGEELKYLFGVMGAYMQPQGHVQVLLNLLVFGMDPQTALDSPRFSIGTNYDPKALVLHLEEGIDESVVKGLENKGHRVAVVRGHRRHMFGRGQIIKVGMDESEGGRRVFSAGSDLRGDGHAVGY